MDCMAQKTYQDECNMLRMHLIELLARPSFGHRTWVDTLLIGDALIELDRQADSMDQEAHLGRHSEQDGKGATKKPGKQ